MNKGTRFITETDSKIRICVGTDSGEIWWVFEEDPFMESKKLESNEIVFTEDDNDKQWYAVFNHFI